MKKERSFPTIIGLIFLTLTIFFGVKLSQKTATTSSQASGDCNPINPQITNITYNSATISFTTSSSCQATINLDNQIINDSKDKTTVHYFESNNLAESKVYQFSIISGGDNFSTDELALYEFQFLIKEAATSGFITSGARNNNSSIIVWNNNEDSEEL